MTSRRSNRGAKSRQLRIIGGQWRGRKLQFPAVPHLRPTSDRVRETLFNWLQTEVIGADCLDLFAGSGALGLEAMSRGAASVTFVDSHRLAIRQLQENSRLLACPACRFVCADAPSFLSSAEPQRFDLVFLDPPFQYTISSQLAALLTERQWLGPNAKIYLESALNAPPPELPASWELLKNKKAGQVRYQLFVFSG